MKTCTGCKQTKGEGEFYRTANGRPMPRCKECHKEEVRSRYRLDVDHSRAMNNQRRKTPHSRALALEAMRRGRAAHPEKYRARTAVSNAVRDGRLIKQPCTLCGDQKVQAHHHDYSKPLDVEWLCFKCHRGHVHGHLIMEAA